jgi:hypothetical protein
VEDTRRDRKACVEAKQVAVAGHPSDEDIPKISDGTYRWFGVVPQGGFPVSIVVIFGALCWRCFENDFLGFLVGVTYEVLVPLWLVTLPRNLS